MATLDVKARIAELEKDSYVKQWISGLAPKTKDNYLRGFLLWNDFLGMTPTEQIKKRMHDLATEDLSERRFF